MSFILKQFEEVSIDTSKKNFMLLITHREKYFYTQGYVQNILDTLKDTYNIFIVVY